MLTFQLLSWALLASSHRCTQSQFNCPSSSLSTAVLECQHSFTNAYKIKNHNEGLVKLISSFPHKHHSNGSGLQSTPGCCRCFIFLLDSFHPMEYPGLSDNTSELPAMLLRFLQPGIIPNHKTRSTPLIDATSLDQREHPTISPALKSSRSFLFRL